MTTIAEENRKLLRQAMRVECGFQETDDEPTSITPSGEAQDFDGLANLDRSYNTAVIMDLGGSGFVNDGNAVPMKTESDSFRYGYISEEAAKADGTFSTPFGLTLTAATTWSIVTLEVMGQYGDKKIIQVEPVWSGGSTTIYLDSWTPGERAYIVGVFLGMTWIWDNSNLLGVNLDLRGVNTQIGGELEVSSIEIQAYETTDYTNIIGQIPIGAPIWYSAGYVDDMSEKRNFYLSETITWDNNVLTVKGQDASMLLANVDIPLDATKYSSGFTPYYIINKRLSAALASIDYSSSGTAPPLDMTAQVIVSEGKAARSIISEYTGLFRDDNYLRVTYVDAGRPTLTYGQVGNNWTIYADEISELNVIVEHNKHELDMVIPQFYEQYNASIEQVEATSGMIYYVDLDPPVPFNITITPTPTSKELINSGLFKFKAAATTTYTIDGYQALENLLDANNPYVVTESENGDTYTYDFNMPFFELTGGQSLTKRALAYVIDRSNIVYEFTYRGNPHIQPRDVLTVELAVWEDEMVVKDGLFPAEDLYPAPDLYPYAEYKDGRKMVKTWETMTVDSVTLEHSAGGGLTSKIRARKGDV